MKSDINGTAYSEIILYYPNYTERYVTSARTNSAYVFDYLLVFLYLCTYLLNWICEKWLYFVSLKPKIEQSQHIIRLQCNFHWSNHLCGNDEVWQI